MPPDQGLLPTQHACCIIACSQVIQHGVKLQQPLSHLHIQLHAQRWVLQCEVVAGHTLQQLPASSSQRPSLIRISCCSKLMLWRGQWLAELLLHLVQQLHAALLKWVRLGGVALEHDDDVKVAPAAASGNSKTNSQLGHALLMYTMLHGQQCPLQPQLSLAVPCNMRQL
jgi:hypothetical protein